MRMYTEFTETIRPTAVALGRFDGLHVGHMAVVSRMLQNKGDQAACVFSFAGPEQSPCLMTPTLRERLLARAGVELLVTPGQALQAMTPAQFVSDVLESGLHARFVVCGFNYRFGAGAAGTAKDLLALCAERGIPAAVVNSVTMEGAPVSSTRIRALIAAGDMPGAAKLLGRPFLVDFTVVKGRQIGRLMGTPTINQPLPPGFVTPRFGVYASAAYLEGSWRPAVTNCGVKPTVGADAPLLETWIPGSVGDLYGQKVPVALLSFMREERKFSSLDALRAQIRSDGDQAGALAAGWNLQGIL